MKVLILHSLPPATAVDRHVWEFDLGQPVRGLTEVLPEAIIAGVRGNPAEILSVLSTHQPDVVFNVCEAPLGRPDLEAHVAALLEWTGVRFTGSGSQTLALCRRKDYVKSVLVTEGVPVPRSNIFPCIVKPADEDGSYGIHSDSICEDKPSLDSLLARFNGKSLVEEFLPGREFAISLWGATGPDHHSIGETIFKQGLRLNTYAAKWEIDSSDYANAPLTYEVELLPKLHEELIAVARAAWRAVNARGYLRVDVRLDADNTPRVIDVNPNPELGPGVGINRAVIEAGWTWERFVKNQIEWA